MKGENSTKGQKGVKGQMGVEGEKGIKGKLGEKGQKGSEYSGLIKIPPTALPMTTRFIRESLRQPYLRCKSRSASLSVIHPRHQGRVASERPMLRLLAGLTSAALWYAATRLHDWRRTRVHRVAA